MSGNARQRRQYKRFVGRVERATRDRIQTELGSIGRRNIIRAAEAALQRHPTAFVDMVRPTLEQLSFGQRFGVAWAVLFP